MEYQNHATWRQGPRRPILGVATPRRRHLNWSTAAYASSIALSGVLRNELAGFTMVHRLDARPPSPQIGHPTQVSASHLSVDGRVMQIDAVVRFPLHRTSPDHVLSGDAADVNLGEE